MKKIVLVIGLAVATFSIIANDKATGLNFA